MTWFWQKELKIGQIWTMKDSDPFHKSEFETEIIDIKNKYVLTKIRIANWLIEKHFDSDLISKDWSDERTYKENEFRFFYDILVKDIE